MKQPRNNKGEWEKHTSVDYGYKSPPTRIVKAKQIFGAILIGLILVLAIGAIMFGTYPIRFVESRIQEKAEVYEKEVDTRDGIQRVTDNIAEMTRIELKQKEKVLELKAQLEKEIEIWSINIASTTEALERYNIYSK